MEREEMDLARLQVAWPHRLKPMLQGVSRNPA